MFFPENITGIRSRDRVLEIGPGASPHPRSNVLLEYYFADEETKFLQRGCMPFTRQTKATTILYTGDNLPFKDAAFDYVIASHVLEHVPDPKNFLQEIFRVGSGRGYLEYPLPYYEYLHDFSVHLHFIKFNHGSLNYLPKSETSIREFCRITDFFYRALECGYNDLFSSFPYYMAEGFEFTEPFSIIKAKSIASMLPDGFVIREKSRKRRIFEKISRSIAKLL